MSWVAIPDSFGDDPRLIELGHEAFARLIRLWCYCGRHENDGIISTHVLNDIVPERIVERLVQRGFVSIEGETANVVGFLDDNMSHAAREAQRNLARAAGILSGKARREKSILERTSGSTERSTERSTSGRTPGPGPEQILRPEQKQEPIQKEAASPQSPPLASTGSVEGKPRKKREKRPAHPNYKPTLDAIDGIYREATGSKPDWTSPKERAAVDRLARSWTLDEILTRARRFWIDHLPGFAWQGKVTVLCVADFAAHFPRLAVIESRNGHHSNGLPDDFVQQRVY